MNDYSQCLTGQWEGFEARRKTKHNHQTHPFSFLPILSCSFPCWTTSSAGLEKLQLSDTGTNFSFLHRTSPIPKHSGRETGTVGHVIDAIQVLLALLVEHVLPMSTHDFQGVLSKENCA